MAESLECNFFLFSLHVLTQKSHKSDRVVTLFVQTNKLTFLLVDRCYEHILLEAKIAKQHYKQY